MVNGKEKGKELHLHTGEWQWASSHSFDRGWLEEHARELCELSFARAGQLFELCHGKKGTDTTQHRSRINKLKKKKSRGEHELTGTQSCSRTLWQPGLLLWQLPLSSAPVLAFPPLLPVEPPVTHSQRSPARHLGFTQQFCFRGFHTNMKTPHIAGL